MKNLEVYDNRLVNPVYDVVDDNGNILRFESYKPIDKPGSIYLKFYKKSISKENHTKYRNYIISRKEDCQLYTLFDEYFCIVFKNTLKTNKKNMQEVNKKGLKDISKYNFGQIEKSDERHKHIEFLNIVKAYYCLRFQETVKIFDNYSLIENGKSNMLQIKKANNNYVFNFENNSVDNKFTICIKEDDPYYSDIYDALFKIYIDLPDAFYRYKEAIFPDYSELDPDKVYIK